MSNVKSGARTVGMMVGIIIYLFFAVLPAAGQRGRHQDAGAASGVHQPSAA